MGCLLGQRGSSLTLFPAPEVGKAQGCATLERSLVSVDMSQSQDMTFQPQVQVLAQGLG